MSLEQNQEFDYWANQLANLNILLVTQLSNNENADTTRRNIEMVESKIDMLTESF